MCSVYLFILLLSTSLSSIVVGSPIYPPSSNTKSARNYTTGYNGQQAVAVTMTIPSYGYGSGPSSGLGVTGLPSPPQVTTVCVSLVGSAGAMVATLAPCSENNMGGGAPSPSGRPLSPPIVTPTATPAIPLPSSSTGNPATYAPAQSLGAPAFPTRGTTTTASPDDMDCMTSSSGQITPSGVYPPSSSAQLVPTPPARIPGNPAFIPLSPVTGTPSITPRESTTTLSLSETVMITLTTTEYLTSSSPSSSISFAPATSTTTAFAAVTPEAGDGSLPSPSPMYPQISASFGNPSPSTSTLTPIPTTTTTTPPVIQTPTEAPAVPTSLMYFPQVSIIPFD